MNGFSYSLVYNVLNHLTCILYSSNFVTILLGSVNPIMLAYYAIIFIMLEYLTQAWSTLCNLVTYVRILCIQ